MSLLFVRDTIRAFVDRSPRGLERRMNLLGRVTARLERVRGIGWGWDTPVEEARAILPLLPARDALLFDVGIHHGDWSATVLAEAGDRVRAIHGFEPSPENCATIASRGLEKLTLVNAAVSSSRGRAPLYSDSPGSGMASLVKRDISHMALAHEPILLTETITLDDYAEAHGIDRIDFVKMDIEGHELAALEGAQRLLARGAIRGVAFEFSGCNLDSRTYFRDFWRLLRPHGFAFYRILKGSRLLPIPEYNSSLENFSIANYVAAK